jgi:hypothetical protein
MQRKPVSEAERLAYIRRSQGPCFICEMLGGNPQYRRHILYQDEYAVAFLNKYPPLDGYALVAPCQHREQVTGDFSLAEYLAQFSYEEQEQDWRAMIPALDQDRLLVADEQSGALLG